MRGLLTRHGVRQGALALIGLATLLLGGGRAEAARGCSPYLNQVVINEVRVGAKNSTDSKNQVELLNVAGVPAAVWQTWTIQTWLKEGTKLPVKKSSIPLSSGTDSSGPFIWNSSAKLYLNNRPARLVDIAVLDANGDFVAYFAIYGTVETLPGCLGTPTVVQGSGGDENGVIKRSPDGGAWPASLTKTSVHTIGRTNDCAAAGGDIVISHEVDWTKPVRNATTVTFVVTAFNNACTHKVSGVKATVSNLSSSNFSSITTAVSSGSGAVTTAGSTMTWDVKDLDPGVSRTLTVTGIPTSLGSLTSTATVSAPTSGLVNTADDSESVTITVFANNNVGFDRTSDTATEGTDLDFSVTVTLNVPASQSTTVSYSRSGSAGAGDTNLPASGSIVIPAGSVEATVDFTITNDTVHEPTKTIELTLTGATSSDLKVKLGTSGTGDNLTQTITLVDDDPLSVDHYELSLPTSSLACLAGTVTVVACADTSSPCTNPATTISGATATLVTSAGALAATSVTFNGAGVASTTLSHAAATDGASARVTLSGTSIGPASGTHCCPDGVACAARSYCDSTFNTAGFVVAGAANGAAATVPTQTAGTASGSWVLRAVKSNTSTKACEAALSGVNDVNWAYQCNDPTTCAAGNRLVLTGNGATAIAANPNAGVSSTTAVAMTFDANGNAPFSFTYGDVGRITLHASKPAGGALLTVLNGVTSAFVVRPAGFVLSNIKCSSYSAGACATAAIASPGNNPAAASGAGTAFIPAGRAFTATVTAVDAGGSAVPNFGKETAPEGVTLAPTLVLPDGGSAGSLSNAGSFGSFAGGAATGTTFAYSEVGIITLTPSLASGNYLGSGGTVTGTTSGHVGRFIPDHFTVDVTPGCSASFTYSGQPFAATLTAHNAAGSPVANHGGGFARPVTLSDAGALGVGSFTAGGSVAAAAFSNGVALASPVYTFTNKLTAPATLTPRATDTDGVSSAGHAEGSTALRSGRLRLANAFGRATAPLQLTALADYWTGQAWVINGDDSCSSVPASAVALSNQRNSQGAATAAWSTTPSSITIASGSGLLTLGAPAPAGTGSIDIGLNLGHTGADQTCLAAHPATTGAGLDWLRSRNGACAASHDRDPSARASFGIFSPESRQTVHVRELF